ncbi:MAG TPA: hypothetical protein VEZ14_07190 [Dehalococcoidia bacterium]|nr:hypothetical protein [Dehalococcoidia bacterium]
MVAVAVGATTVGDGGRVGAAVADGSSRGGTEGGDGDGRGGTAMRGTGVAVGGTCVGVGTTAAGVTGCGVAAGRATAAVGVEAGAGRIADAGEPLPRTAITTATMAIASVAATATGIQRRYRLMSHPALVMR